MIAWRHFIFPINSAQPRDDHLISLFLFLPRSFFTSFLDYGKKKEKKKDGRKRDAQREAKKTEGRKEGSEYEEGVLGEVSRGRGAISRLSIMEPVRSYREPAAGEELAFHPTNLS